MSTGVPRPGQVRLYGNSTSGNPNWTFGGNSCTMAFIHAPNANIGFSGGGNGCGNNITIAHVVANANLILAPSTPFTSANFVSPNPSNNQGPNLYGGVWSRTYNSVVGNNSNAGVFYEQPGLMKVIGQSMGSGFPQFNSETTTMKNITTFTRLPVPQ